MKKLTLIGVTAFALLSLSAGCKVFGVNPAPPTATERNFFTVQTNYVQMPVTVTNVVMQTNTVTQTSTNTIGQTVTVTNEVLVPKLQIVTETNIVPVYTMTPSEATKGTAQAVGAITNTFAPGVGSAVAAGLLALFAAWGHARSYKGAQATDTLTQEIESIREFIKTLPQGTAYDSAITTWLMQHQVESGAAKTILDSLAKNCSNTEAQGAAKEIRDTLAALTTPQAPPKT